MQNQEDKVKQEGSESTDQNNTTDRKTENGQQNDVNSESGENVTNTNNAAADDSKLQEMNDKYLRLYSEYDNYRKRTMKEKADIIKTAGEEVFKAILPVMDDFERAIKANETVEDASAIKEGLKLIYNKFKNSIQQKGLTAFESKGEVFNPDTMEAITHIPAEDKDLKGKVVDEVEKGYKLGDKVIRFAKVVVGQ
jgi:molecular chaperone GrpE